MAKNIKVTKETSTGLNIQFQIGKGRTVNRTKLVKEIQSGVHPDYHVRKINGKNVPCSNPDKSKHNNLG